MASSQVTGALSCWWAGEVAIALTNWLAGRLGDRVSAAQGFEVQSLVGGKLAGNQASLRWIRLSSQLRMQKWRGLGITEPGGWVGLGWRQMRGAEGAL